MPLALFNVTSLDEWQDALADHGGPLLLIVVVLVAAEWLFRRLFSRIFRAAIQRAARGRADDPVGVERRANTLTATLNWAFGIFLVFLGVALVLDELGVSVAALIAGVGVVGIAIGLGAQALVRDVINGMFILIEDQYRVGDVVTIAGVTGTVVEINPRRTVLRDADGNVHSIPNGAISIATNMTQGYSSINVDIPITYDADLDRARALIDSVGEELAKERPNDFVGRPPRVLRISNMLENWLTLRVGGDVRAGLQWELTSELRRRVKERFDAEGITMTPAGRYRPVEEEVQGRGLP